MSSGYVTTNLGEKPDRVRSNGSPTQVDLSALVARAKFSVNEFKFRNPITSFRSGPAFERESKKPGAIFSYQTLGEFLAAEAGDLGHTFSVNRVTQFYGNTRSRRPSTQASPLWGKFTNPIVTCFANADDISRSFNVNTFLDRGNSISDSSYGFAKNNSDLVTLGTSFIKETNPIQSQVNLLSDIAEALVDKALLPGLLGKTIVSSVIDPRKRASLIRSIGSEYLNYIFGYKPLADDAAKVGVLIDTVNKLVDQWIKDSGTIVRRRRRSGPVQTVPFSKDYIANGQGMSLFTLDFPLAGRVDNQVNPSAVTFRDTSTANQLMSLSALAVRTVSSEITFSAGYQYDFRGLFNPVEGGSAADLMHNAALRNELTAIAFGLDTSSIGGALYDATPFSWLLDWFVNVGDVIDNFRGLQSRGVQMLWGYVTETATRDTFLETVLDWTPTGENFFRSSGHFTQKVINRVRATPFGFGTSFGSLSASQSATLAALAAAKAL